jgi:hypothetical protein
VEQQQHHVSGVGLRHVRFLDTSLHGGQRRARGADNPRILSFHHNIF